ncbi:uncharacterized protein [Clytia hemisphaerica]|uniref:Uncharacterized protein n=1 Tax=Clytia hemisphaerica TaxID=252671 RepID=A0A7M5XC88_9CNID
MMNEEEEFENIIDFDDDPDFDEEELFTLECHPDPHDETTEVVVPDDVREMLNEGVDDDAENVFVLDEIPTVTFVSDETVNIIPSSSKSAAEKPILICENCSKKYKMKFHYNKHILICKPKSANVSDKSTTKRKPKQPPANSTKKAAKTITFPAVFKAHEKKDYVKDSTARFLGCLKSCADDPFFNLKSACETPGNMTVKLAKSLLENDESCFDEIAKQFSEWLLPALNLPGTSDAREHCCKLFIQEMISSESNHQIWKTFLTKIGINLVVHKRPVNMLFSFVATKFFEESLIWKNAVLIKTGMRVDYTKLKMSEHEEKILRYVAGYIPYSLKRQYWSRRHESTGLMITELVSSWMVNEDQELTEHKPFYEYTLSWTNRINRGGLMIVNEVFFVFVKRMEMVVRDVLNKTLIRNYKGEDLRDLIMTKMLKNELLDRSWRGITRIVHNKELVDVIKKVIFRKWMTMRIKSFVNAWIQSIKWKASKEKQAKKAAKNNKDNDKEDKSKTKAKTNIDKVSRQAEPGLRKALYSSK